MTVSHSISYLGVITFVVAMALLTKAKYSSDRHKRQIDNLLNLRNDFMSSFAHEWMETGAVVLPNQKVVICSYNKAGCTTVKWIILSILYNQSYCSRKPLFRQEYPKAMAIEDSGKGGGFVQDNHIMYTKQGLQYLRHLYPPPLSPPANNPRHTLSHWETARMFLDPTWTKIAFVRDPWERSISMYFDQMARKRVHRSYSSPSRANFSAFILHSMTIRQQSRNRTKHMGSAANFCGLRYLDYDYYVNISDLQKGLEPVLQARPEFRSVLTSGWTNCTVSGSDSLLTSESDTGHQNSRYGSKENKLKRYDEMFCDDNTTALVYSKFADDYAIFKRHNIFPKHKCLVTS